MKRLIAVSGHSLQIAQLFSKLSRFFSGKNLVSLTQKSSCSLYDVIVGHDVNNQSNDVIGNAQNMTTTSTMRTQTDDKLISVHCS